MYTNVSANVSATLNERDIITLLEEGELSTEEVTLRMAEPEAEKLREALSRNA